MQKSAYQQDIREASIEASEHGQDEKADELALLAGNDGLDDDALQTSAIYGGIMLSDVEELPIEWPWENWIPRGYVSFLVGDSRVGKSTVLRDLAARFTTGSPLPDGTPGRVTNVVYISYEEPTSDILKPRLRQAGADMTRVCVLSTVKRGHDRLGQTIETPFAVPEDLELLENVINATNAGIVFIDPLMSMVHASRSTARNQSARDIMTQLQNTARHTGVAIVIIGHLTKGHDKDLLQRMGGSKGWSDYARIVLGLDIDGNNARRRVLWVEKNNCSEYRGQLTFELVHGKVHYTGGEKDALAAEQARLATSRQAILKVLLTNPTKTWQADELARQVNISWDNARKVLTRMLAVGQISSPSRGLYCACIPAEKNNVK